MGSSNSTEIDESIKLFVDSAITGKKVVVFSKSYCPYCVKAKNTLKEYNINPDKMDIIELEKRPDCSMIQAYMKSLTGASSVPRIFIDGKFIGGCDEMMKLHRQEELKTILSQADALEN